MLPVNCGSHADYQNFVVKNLRKYYPNPDAIARSTWDIIVAAQNFCQKILFFLSKIHFYILV